MPYTITLIAVVLGYTWALQPLLDVRNRWAAIPVIMGIIVCIAHNMKSGDWGFAHRAFVPAFLWSVALTIPIVAALWFIGHAMGPAPVRRAPLLDFLYVTLWGGGQQFALQTVVFRESQAAAGRAAVPLAAAIFACLHLPNPFLMIVTFVGGITWCWIYSRHPNIIPLALSHAAATVVILMSFDPAITAGLRTGWHYFQ